MNISGIILELFDTIQISETFKKREFVIEVKDNNYPELIKFEAIQDRCNILDQYSIGQTITVDFNLKGRKWTNPQGEVNYFNTLQAWRISGATSSEPNNNDQLAKPEVPESASDEDEEIPF